MRKIEKLTPDQEKYLAVFREEYLQAAISGKRADRTKLESAIEDAYSVIGKPKPVVIILQSPQQAMMAISFMKHFNEISEKDQLGDQLGDQLRDQLGGQLGSQLGSQLWVQLGDQLRSQLRDQLRDQLWVQLEDQLGSQLWVQLGDQLGSQLRDQLGDQLEDQLEDQLRSQPIYESTDLWGSQDLFWISFYKFGEHIGVKYAEEQSRRLEIMRRIGFECEWWWPYEGFCIVSERPKYARFDDRRLLHCENGPSVLYDDGYSVYSWHGVNIPKDWIEDKGSIDPKHAITWKNMEQRRALSEILGWNTVLEQLDAKIIDQDNDPQIGTLLEVNLPDVGKEKFLRVTCGTGRQFALPMPPEIKTAREGNSWSYGLEPEQLRVEVRT